MWMLNSSESLSKFRSTTVGATFNSINMLAVSHWNLQLGEHERSMEGIGVVPAGRLMSLLLRSLEASSTVVPELRAAPAGAAAFSSFLARSLPLLSFVEESGVQRTRCRGKWSNRIGSPRRPPPRLELFFWMSAGELLFSLQ
jgi:hypothetical protein